MTTYEAQHPNKPPETRTLPQPDFTLDVRTDYLGKREIGIVTPVGKIGGATLKKFSEELQNIVDQGAEHIILDLERVTLLSSGGLREMYHYLQELPIIVVRPSTQAQKTMELAGSQDQFEEYKTISDALLALKSRDNVH